VLCAYCVKLSRIVKVTVRECVDACVGMFIGTMHLSLMERMHRKEKLKRRSDSDHWITHSEFLMAVRYEFRQEKRIDGGKISSIIFERGDQPSSDLGEATRYLKFNMKGAYKVLKIGGPSIIGQDMWLQFIISLTGNSKEGRSLTFQLMICEITIRSGPPDLD